MNDLRSRVVLQTDGQLKTGRDVVIGALLGAEEFGFSTAPLITLGCIMMRKCHLNTCPVGIATQNAELRKKFDGLPEHVVNYLFMVAEEAREYMAAMGFRSINEMVGRVDALEVDGAIQHWKSDGLDLTSILTPAERPHDEVGVYCTKAQDHGLELTLDRTKLLDLAEPALKTGERVAIELPICQHQPHRRYDSQSRNRQTLGSRLLAGRHRPHQVQRFGRSEPGSVAGAWRDHRAGGRRQRLCRQGALRRPGDHLSAAELDVSRRRTTSSSAMSSSTALPAARRSSAARAAERFCVRNSGAHTVIEGIGDHGCEYMTGGRVVVLGPTGRNFAAGMSGGIAYVWDPQDEFIANCNLGTVELEKVETEEDRKELRDLVDKHRRYTGSSVADSVLADWDASLQQFVKVMPTDFKRVLAELAREQQPKVPS